MSTAYERLPAPPSPNAHFARGYGGQAFVGRKYDRIFYSAMAIACAVAVFIGFYPTYYLRPQFQLTSLPLYLHVHGFVFTTWILLFIAQTLLVAAHRVDVHRRLGWAIAGWAALVVVVGTAAGILSMRRNFAAGLEREAMGFLTTPLFSMAVFAGFVGAAIYYRRQAGTHKRLMLLATIGLLDAAIARWPTPLVATNLGGYSLNDSFIVAAIIYDVASRRRIHPVYIWGTLVIVIFQFLRDVIGATAAWHSIARAILA